MLLLMNTIAVSIVHCTRFTDRKKYLDKQLLALGETTVNWCTERDLDSEDFVFKYSKGAFGLPISVIGFDLGVNARTLVKSRRTAYWEGIFLFLRFLLTRKKHLILGSVPSRNETLRNIDFEVQKMHLLALHHGVSTGSNWILVLEDDSIFEPSEFQRIYQIAKYFNPRHPIWISLNGGAGLVRTKSDKWLDFEGLYRVKPSAVRCSSAYLVSSSFANEFLSLIDRWGIPDWLPIDYIFHLSMRRISKVRTFWQDPPIFLQGSEIGAYKSGLRKS